MMKKFIICFILLQLNALINVSDAQTCTQTSCLHSGQLNTAMCKCSCFPNYSGNYCQYVNCTQSDPPACGVYITADQCTATSIKHYCPRLCNVPGCTCSSQIDECLNGGTFNPSTCTCTCPAGYTGTVCETRSTCTTLTCQNSGSFNATSCKCDCFPNYSGNLCESLNCSVADSSYCVNFNTYDCNTVQIVQSYCPNKCGRCLPSTASTSTASTSTASTSTASTSTASTSTASTSTASTSTASTSTASTSTASTSTASTSTASTSTASTSTASTSTGSTSTASSSTASTSTASTSTGSTSTASSTTASTTTASTSTGSTSTCAALTCLNGGVIQNCACTCPPAFSGTSCQTFNCAATDSASCVFFTSASCSTNSAIPQICPNLCGVRCS